MKRRDWIKNSSLAIGATYLSRASFGNEASAEKASFESSHGFTNLSINENQFGPSPLAVKAIKDSSQYAQEYPLGGQARLKSTIARHEGVSVDQVILGAGSSDIIMGASSVFGLGGGNIVSSDPSFGPLMMWAKKFGIEHVKIPWTSNHGIDLEGIEKAITSETQVVYICNPENPVGTMAGTSELYEFCKRVSQRCPILIDEAYLDFAGDVDKLTMMRCVREGMPVIVLRTFSKAYGLGGMRVGYAVCQKELAAELSDYYVTGIGCGCSHVSLEAALAAYHDQDYLKSVRERTAEMRSQTISSLKEKGYEPIPSVTTFVLVPIEKDSKAVADAIFGGFGVKVSPRFYYEQNFLRISMGRPDQMAKLDKALKIIL
ncbi:aminotransferase class I/II-fold pyridoxal phosphate-dependent enzyme [Puniceicoccaceae bacterium K14]|nr:aminotransferase class I/II-fold pyridoxal phosphate-dependent enzyme [Puniceicoccaceae bacterium K14]